LIARKSCPRPDRLWPGTFVADANLSNLVAEIREALGDDAHAPQSIRTSHGFGYAFCANATTTQESRETPPDRPTCWLECDRRRFPLAEGEHVIGRDPDVEVRLDSSTVSRRHARIVITAEGAALEDFDSKNGTGDVIRIGSLVVTFHVRSPMSTDTQAQPGQ
jgi:hypothetical protein